MATPIHNKPTQPAPSTPPPATRTSNAPAKTPQVSPATGHTTKSSFESGSRAAPISLGNFAASTLRTERLGDGSANCLERAAAIARPGDQVVLLRDSRDAVGHAVVQHRDGTVTDPNFPNHRYESLSQWRAMNPQYHSPAAIPDTQLEGVLRTPPGPQRDALISQLGLSSVANQAVADPIQQGLEITFEPPSIEGNAGRLGGSITSGPYAGTSVELTWDASRAGPDGRFPVTVEVVDEAGVMSQGELQVGHFGIEGGTAAGVSNTRTYTLNLTQADLDRLQRGELSLPTIADPRALPTGTSIVMNTELFGSANLGVSFGPLSVSEEVRAGRGYAFGVERLDGDRVRISVGPTSAFERSQSLGLGFELGDVELSAELGRSAELTGAALASVELDLSTAEGRAAYQQFLRTGNLPPDGPGVSNRATTQVLSLEEAASLGINVGPLSLGGALWNEATSVVVTNQGGQMTATVNTTAAYSGNNISTSYRFENGQPVFESMSFDVSLPGDQRATVRVDGQQGLDTLQRISFEAARANFMTTIGLSTEEELDAFIASKGREDYMALTLEPGDPGFSGQAWLEAYSAFDATYGGMPSIPAVAMAAIRSGAYEGAPADRAEALRVDLVGNLRTEAGNYDVFSGPPSADADWLDFGLNNNPPGLQVTLPPGY